MIAFVCELIRSITSFGSTLYEVSEISAKTGIARTPSTASAVAMKVLTGTITSSPSPISRARSVSSKAEVPEDTPTQ